MIISIITHGRPQAWARAGTCHPPFGCILLLNWTYRTTLYHSKIPLRPAFVNKVSVPVKFKVFLCINSCRKTLSKWIIYALFSLPVVCFEGGGNPKTPTSTPSLAPLGDFRPRTLNLPTPGKKSHVITATKLVTSYRGFVASRNFTKWEFRSACLSAVFVCRSRSLLVCLFTLLSTSVKIAIIMIAYSLVLDIALDIVIYIRNLLLIIVCSKTCNHCYAIRTDACTSVVCILINWLIPLAI